MRNLMIVAWMLAMLGAGGCATADALWCGGSRHPSYHRGKRCALIDNREQRPQPSEPAYYVSECSACDSQ
jgi:hypothetical protein